MGTSKMEYKEDQISLGRRLARKIFRWKRALLGGSLLIGLIGWVGPTVVVNELGRLQDPQWFVSALVLGMIVVILFAFRWILVCRIFAIDLPLSTAIKEYYISTVLNLLIPGGVGGEFNRAYRIAQSMQLHEDENLLQWKAARTVLYERLIGQLALFLYLGGCGVMKLGFVSTFVSSKSSVFLLPKWVKKSIPQRKEVTLILQNSKIFIYTLLLSLLANLALLIAYLFCAWSLGYPLEIDALFSYLAIALGLMALPNWGGIGARDIFALAGANSVGLTEAQGLTCSLVYTLFIALSATPGIYFWIRHKEIRHGSIE